MPILEEAANALNMTPAELERKSIKVFMEKELTSVEADLFKIAAKHGVSSVMELDARLQKGEVTEEDLMDDFMEFDFLESRKNELIKVLGKLN